MLQSLEVTKSSSDSTIDQSFLDLPLKSLGKAALSEAKKLGAEYADFRFERIKQQNIDLKDARVENVLNHQDIGYAVRLIVNGAWGFAASSDLSAGAVKKTVKNAVELAKASRPLSSEEVKLAKEPKAKGTYASDFEINPFEVELNDKIDRLSYLANLAQRVDTVNHTSFDVEQVLENKYLISSEGSDITQQRVRVQGILTAINVNRQSGKFESMTTTAPPTGRGWEWFLGKENGYDYEDEILRLPALIEAKMAAPSVKPGKYDLVIDPTNLFLTIHESVGHATELDRALGYEANYAGTSFATKDKLGKLKYGSELMHITGDRTAKYGLATIGYDDEGVAAQEWDIVKNGKLVGYQLNRQMAGKIGKRRSNGCAFADSFLHPPLQRMPNVSLQPNKKEDLSTEDLISQVDDGIYIVGNNSWSIDMQRYNFQFTGQRFYKITNGRLDGQLKDVAYQATTTDFWRSLKNLGGPSTYMLGGAFNCGKGQPGQVAPVSHGCPSALFEKVNVLNTQQEGGGQ